jgi:hypothetical protein
LQYHRIASLHPSNGMQVMRRLPEEDVGPIKAGDGAGVSQAIQKGFAERGLADSLCDQPLLRKILR